MVVAHQNVLRDACMGYQNVSSNIKNNNFGVLDDFKDIGTLTRPKCVPERGVNFQVFTEFVKWHIKTFSMMPVWGTKTFLLMPGIIILVFWRISRT